MRYQQIKKHDVANGPGIRVTIFVSGCSHNPKCPECFNEETWDFNCGTLFTQDTISEIITELKKDYICGLTLLGGEPMDMVNQKGLLELVLEVRKEVPEKDIWCFTGYKFKREKDDNDPEPTVLEMYEKSDITKQLVDNIDVIVDGKFIKALHDPRLVYKGSSNQNTILVKETLANDNILVLWELEKYI